MVRKAKNLFIQSIYFSVPNVHRNRSKCDHGCHCGRPPVTRKNGWPFLTHQRALPPRQRIHLSSQRKDRTTLGLQIQLVVERQQAVGFETRAGHVTEPVMGVQWIRGRCYLKQCKGPYMSPSGSLFISQAITRNHFFTYPWFLQTSGT